MNRSDRIRTRMEKQISIGKSSDKLSARAQWIRQLVLSTGSGIYIQAHDAWALAVDLSIYANREEEDIEP